MKTLNRWQEELWAAGKTVSEVSKKEIIEGLDIIAQAMMEGKATLAPMRCWLSGMVCNPKKTVPPNMQICLILPSPRKERRTSKIREKSRTCRANGKEGRQAEKSCLTQKRGQP